MSKGVSTLEEVAFVINPLGEVGIPDALGPLLLNIIANKLNRSWFPNGASIGIMPGGKESEIFTFDLVQMMNQLVTPSPWPHEPMIGDSFTFCDSTGTPLEVEAASNLKIELLNHRAAVLQAMGVSPESKDEDA